MGGPGLGSPPTNPRKVCCFREDLPCAESRWQSCCRQHRLAPGVERDEGWVEAWPPSFTEAGGIHDRAPSLCRGRVCWGLRWKGHSWKPHVKIVFVSLKALPCAKGAGMPSWLLQKKKAPSFLLVPATQPLSALALPS